MDEVLCVCKPTYSLEITNVKIHLKNILGIIYLFITKISPENSVSDEVARRLINCDRVLAMKTIGYLAVSEVSCEIVIFQLCSP